MSATQAGPHTVEHMHTSDPIDFTPDVLVALVGERADWSATARALEAHLIGSKCVVFEGIEALDAPFLHPHVLLVDARVLEPSLAAIRAARWSAHVPVLALSDDPDERVRARTLGAWDALGTDPTTPDALAHLDALLRLSVRVRELEHQRDVLFDLATTDPLTRLPNRRHLHDVLGRELDRARRHRQEMSVALFDVDHFKDVNDAHGHAVGDVVLLELARLADQMVRGSDLLARLGGEEFVLVMPQTTLEQAQHVCERLRSAIARMRVRHQGVEVGVTVSVGVTSCRTQTDDVDAILDRADQAMYEAKGDGRNRVLPSVG